MEQETNTTTEAANKKVWIRPLVVICGGEKPGSKLKKTIGDAGFKLQPITVMKDLEESAAAHGTSKPLAFLMWVRSAERQITVIKRALQFVPLGRFVIFAPGLTSPPARIAPAVERKERLLWLSSSAQDDESVRALRRFLDADGYFWARQLDGGENGLALPEDLRGSGESETEEPEFLRRFTEDLSSYTELTPLLEAALSRVMSALQCDSGSIYLWNENKQKLVLEAAKGPEENRRKGLRQCMGEGLAGWVAEVKDAILVTDAHKIGRLKGRRHERYTDPSCMSCPVTHHGKLLGVLCVTMRRGGGPFEPADLRLARVLSDRLAELISPLSLMSELDRLDGELKEVFKCRTNFLRDQAKELVADKASNLNVLDCVPVGVLTYDEELSVSASNRTARHFLNSQADDSPAAPLEEHLDVDSAEWREELREVVANGTSFYRKRVPWMHNGHSAQLDVYAAPLTFSDGSAVGGVLTFCDVTDDVEAENRHVATERLNLAGKIAENISDRLNSPPHGVLPLLNNAARNLRVNPAEAKQYLNRGKQKLFRTTNALIQLLAFSGGHTRSDGPFAIEEAVDDCLSLHEDRIAASRVEVEKKIPRNLPPCSVSDLAGALNNVVQNALDAMPEGGKLTIRAKEAGKNVAITVGDTGPGVAEEDREKIFEPFFSTRASQTSTGLGLSLCRDSLRQHGGDVRLTSCDNGAEFEILVPADEQE